MTEEKKKSAKNYKGFVAGVFSGIAKLTGMSSLLSSSSFKETSKHSGDLLDSSTTSKLHQFLNSAHK
jgi:hypothetical protein